MNLRLTTKLSILLLLTGILFPFPTVAQNTWEEWMKRADLAKTQEDRLFNYNQAIEQDPKREEAYLKRGNLHMALRQYLMAIQDFSQVLRNDAKKIEALIGRGNGYIALKQFMPALKDYDKIIALDSKNVTALTIRGEIYTQIGNFEQALKDLNEAVRLNDQFFIAYNNRGKVFMLQKEYKKAISEYDKTLELSPKYTKAFFNRANTYYHLMCSDWKEACLLKDETACSNFVRAACYQLKFKQIDERSPLSTPILPQMTQ